MRREPPRGGRTTRLRALCTTIPDDRGDESFADDLNMGRGIVSGRVALLLRSTEIPPHRPKDFPLRAITKFSKSRKNFRPAGGRGGGPGSGGKERERVVEPTLRPTLGRFRTLPALRASAASRRPAPAGGPSRANYRNFRRSEPLQYKYNVRLLPAVMRSYQGYYTRSHQNSEVKRLWAGIVLGWVTSREVPVLHPLLRTPFSLFSSIHSFFF